jgi:hypothetical protein
MGGAMNIWGYILVSVLPFGIGLSAAPSTLAVTSPHPSSVAASLAQQENDLDCEDFETQEEAQAVLDEDPADPNNLDPNADGIACALLPSASDLDPAPRDAANGEDAEDVQVEQDTGDGNQTREERRAARQTERQTNQEGEQQEEAPVTCADFVNQEDAQAAFDADPDTLADLDADGNGIACEELLETEPVDDELTQAERRAQRQANQDEEPADIEVVIDEPAAPLVREDIDCIDFTFQEEAQRVLNQDPSDPYNLDPSGDGFACTSLASSDPVVSQVPRTGTGMEDQSDASALLAAGLLAILGAGSLVLRRGPRLG